jgi:hypothetical protein
VHLLKNPRLWRRLKSRTKRNAARAFDWKSYLLMYHEVGHTPSFSDKRSEIGIACLIQYAEFQWAAEMAKFAANIVARITVRLAEISPCISSFVHHFGGDQACLYIADAWSAEYKESLFEESAQHNAWLGRLYPEHAAALEANPKCTSLQVQQQLAEAANVGGLRPELAAKWQAKEDGRDALRRAPATLPSGTVVPYDPR